MLQVLGNFSHPVKMKFTTNLMFFPLNSLSEMDHLDTSFVGPLVLYCPSTAVVGIGPKYLISVLVLNRKLFSEDFCLFFLPFD